MEATIGPWLHAYPYAPGLATFLVETDERTWRNAGLDGFDAAAAAPGANDEVSRRYLEQVFSADLGGERLQANNSRWARFAISAAGAGARATSSSSGTPHTPLTSRSDRAPPWPWTTPSPWRRN
ncbi:hypothetical protein [Actinomadura soli]|uniref:hypothetical protein n=1 Tax=Actinomadura soli TaxID=2508997 RepID=UPI001E65D2B8|nr:hypothetical protein [Actinomadura soli]